MAELKKIACVTGASGMVGRRIVQNLILNGYSVRVLSRRKCFQNGNVKLFRGGIENEKVIKSFLREANLLFHCAAEIHDESKMWSVNVLGTEKLLRLVENSKIEYLCYLSSAGVVGRTKIKWVTEETICDPQSNYEKSKWAAEQLVAKGIYKCKTVILRPTNVIDEKRLGAMNLLINYSIVDRFKIYIKGNECAHIVHAKDVADAAMHFVLYPIDSPSCFFVSCDHEKLNTYAGLLAIYKAIKSKRSIDSVRIAPQLPLIVPHLIRMILKNNPNRGDIRYSSKKLLSKNFTFRLGIEGGIKKIISQFNYDRI